MGKGVTYWGSGRNDETETRNIRAEKYDYPSSHDPSDPATVSKEGAAVDSGYPGSIKVPMNQGNVSSKATKRSETEPHVPQL